MTENPHHENTDAVEADVSGHLATALFVGVIVIVLLAIYGLAMAA